ncbi:MAG: type II toxin-antitoxin system HicA family toxin [Candidatus Pacebacteria bacterium]|nr:type II toxin-antitoxin system HicA family toxin [Candidatus Paceibacterota bacterium]MCF7862625.1 type II toxin-antitoxin system HicA family toxin [Candidatus Paceibacterota bacterium]
MPKLNRLSSRKIIKKLLKIGFVKSHQRGSHLVMMKEKKIVVIPIHGSKDIPIGTLYNIVVKQAGLSIEEFNNL